MLKQEKPKTRGAGRLSKSVKEAVEFAFTKVNNEGYLIWLSREHPAAFCSLIGKCIPATVALDVKHTFDLGAAMLTAQDGLTRLNNADVINVTPDKPDNLAKSLITKDK